MVLPSGGSGQNLYLALPYQERRHHAKKYFRFYWQLIGDAWTKPTGNVTARVLLPVSVARDQIWAFGHGP